MTEKDHEMHYCQIKKNFEQTNIYEGITGKELMQMNTEKAQKNIRSIYLSKWLT